MTTHEEKILKNLMMHSVTNDINELREEWEYSGIITTKNNCNLCGHKIKTNVIILNKKNGVHLNIGIECAAIILSNEIYWKAFDEFNTEVKKYKKIVNSLELANRFDIAKKTTSHKESELMKYGLIPRRTDVDKKIIEEILNYYGFSLNDNY